MTERDPAERFRPSGASADAPAATRRLARAALALAITILLGFLVIRVSTVNALLELGPDAASLVSRDHPEAVLGRAFDELRLSGGVSDEAEAAAMTAFRSAPLSEIPLLIAAREIRARGDDSRADQLLAIAVRRNPRSRYAQLLQLERDLRLGRDRDAAVRMAVLSRLVSDAGPILVGELARMAADPETRASAAQVMASDPRLRVSVLEALASRRVDPEVVLGLAGPQPAMPAAEAPRWQNILLDGLVRRGEIERALAAWTRLVGPDATSRDGVYDPDFQGLPGPPPFNWVLETSGDGFAERTAGGLQAEFYGRNDARLASQLILLAPGRYELSFEAEGEAEEDDEVQLSWILSCHPGDRTLLAVPITGVDLTPKRYTGAFTIPPGCEGQWLRLVGDAAEFPEDQRVMIRRLRIARAGQ